MLTAKSPALWLSLAALTLVTRLPFFFVDVIDWDESTFILMGHSLLHGFLPYTFIWDNKPPAIFFLFAGIISLGNDVLMARIFGAVLVLATAMLVFAFGKRMHSARAGVFGAVVYVLGMSATASGQAATSELISTYPVMVALWMLIQRRGSMVWYVIIGMLLSLATLIRLNLALVVVACGLLIVVYEASAGPKQCIKALVAYGVGGIGVLVAFMLPYVFDGSFGMFWYSVFEAPFAYATTQSGPLANLVQHAFNAMGVRWGFDPPQFAVGLAAWVMGVVGGAIAIKASLGADREQRLTLISVLVFVIATGLSIVVSGVAPMHYLIGLLPFMTLFAGIAYAYLAERRLIAVATAMIAVCAVVMLVPVVAEYRTAGQRLQRGATLMHGPSLEIADYLKAPCAKSCKLYLLEDHLAYTLLDVYPPRKIVTHPSNISKPSLLKAEIGAEPTIEGEMRAVLATHPDFIVKREKVWYLQPAQEQILDQMLQQHYQLVHEVDGRRIYRATGK